MERKGAKKSTTILLRWNILILCLSLLGCGGGSGNSSLTKEEAALKSSHNTKTLALPQLSTPSKNHTNYPSATSIQENTSTSFGDIKKAAYELLLSVISETCISGCGGSNPLSVNVSGTVTFDFVPISNSNGLDFANVETRPARGLVVEILDSQNAIVVTTQTDSLGFYSVRVPNNTLVKVRVKTQMQSKSMPVWDVKVTDNTNKYAVYAIEGELRNSGDLNSIRNLHASEKLTYFHGVDDRSASPFNIIDIAYTLLSRMAYEANIDNFPSLEFRWSEKNRAVSGDESLGEIGGTGYFVPDSRVIYLSGNSTTSMHDFDNHVIAHEVGHYITYALFRGSNGMSTGPHNEWSINDIRISFNEGIATAYAGILLNDPQWREVAIVNGKPVSTYNGSNLNCGTCFPNNGAYTEGNVHYLVYTYFNRTKNQFSKPLENFFNLFSDKGFMESAVFPSIYLFAAQVEKLNPIQFVDFQLLLNQQNIFGRGVLGEGETFAADIPFVLPHYPVVQSGQQPVQICTTSYYYNVAANYSAFGLHRTLLLKINSSGKYSVKVTKVGGDLDPVVPHLAAFQASQYKFWLYSNVANGVDLNSWGGLPPYFNAGEYVLDIEGNTNTSFAGKNIKSCFDVSVAAM